MDLGSVAYKLHIWYTFWLPTKTVLYYIIGHALSMNNNCVLFKDKNLCLKTFPINPKTCSGNKKKIERVFQFWAINN